MYSLTLENEWHSSVELTHNEDKWQVTSVTGLNAPTAIISTSTIAGFDGSRFNTSRLDNRNIVITFVINGNVETNRMRLNSIVMPKRYIKLYYKNRSKDLYIEGYVETFEYDIFSNKTVGQISILCPSPYFIDNEANVVEFTAVIDLFEFPFSLPSEGIALSEIMDIPTNTVNNYGNAETGVEIILEARHNVIQPTIMNLTTGQSITVRTEMLPADRIIISTLKGNKYIKKDCNCVESNLINDLTDDSSWIQLVPGDNRFTYSALYGEASITMTVSHRDLYGGV